MTFRIQNPVVGSQAIADNSATQKHPLGTILRADDEVYESGEFIYLKGVASCIVGAFVTYNMDDGSSTLLVGNAIGPIAVAMSVCVAGEFGWFQIQGKAVGKVSAGFTDGSNCYATATPGEVDNAIVAGDRVKRCKGASAIDTPSTGLAEMEIDRPFADDAVAA